MLFQQILEDSDGRFRLVFPQTKCPLKIRQNIATTEFQLLTAATRAHCVRIVGHDGTFFRSTKLMNRMSFACEWIRPDPETAT
jgi:hypothetical protein